MQVPWVRGFLGVQSTNVCATRVMSWLPQEGGAPSFAQRAFLEKALTRSGEAVWVFGPNGKKNNEHSFQFRYDQEDQNIIISSS